MARGAKRFDWRARLSDATEIIPVVGDDDTGEVPVHARLETAAADGQHLEPPDSHETQDGPADVSDRAARLAAAVRRQLAVRGAVVLARLGSASRARLPALGNALRPRLPRLAITIAAGLLLCASFPPLNWWWAAVVAFALLAWVLTRPATTLAGGFGYGFLCGLAFYLPLLPWIGNLVGAAPWIALSVVCALFPGIFGLLAVVVRQLPGWPICFAVLWAAQEWLKSSVPFGGFPWGVVGFGQTDGPFLPLVRLGGVPLLSVAIVLIGCSVTAIAHEIVLWWQDSRAPNRTSGEDKVGKPPSVVLPGICICLVFFITVIVWPQVRHAGTGSGNEPAVTVAAVQGNVPRLGLDFNSQRRAVLDNHVRETLRLADDVHAGRAPQPQFVVWPEGASDIDPLLNADAAQQISVAAAAIGAPILVGTVLAAPDSTPENPADTNVVIVWNPGTGPADRHTKQIVQPFGEYLPWPWLFKRLSGFAAWAGHFVPGHSTGVVHAAGIPVGVATCWEVIFDRAARESVRNGAQVLAMPSNNATFNQTMSEQQLAFDKVRAVEHDRYVVVAGTVGISAVIAPDGHELARTGFFQPDYLDTQVRLETTLTPATRWGSIVQWLLVAAGVAVVAAAMLHNGWFPRPYRRRLRPTKESDAPDDRDGDSPPDDAEDDTAPEEGRRHSARSGPDRGAT